MGMSAQQLVVDRPQVVVYTLDEFCMVFNGQQREVSVLQKFPKILNMDRMRLIPNLFSSLDSISQEEVDRFVTYVSRWDKRISEDSIRAFVDLEYRDLKGKPVRMTAEMAQEHRDVGDIWVMKDIKSPSFVLGDETRIGLIGFTNNEVAFQEFGHNAGCNPTDIAGQEFKPDYVTLFLYLTANKLIKFHHSENVRYIVRLDDYTIKISQIMDKDKPVMGWMITGLAFKERTVFGDIR